MSSVFLEGGLEYEAAWVKVEATDVRMLEKKDEIMLDMKLVLSVLFTLLRGIGGGGAVAKGTTGTRSGAPSISMLRSKKSAIEVFGCKQHEHWTRLAS